LNGRETLSCNTIRELKLQGLTTIQREMMCVIVDIQTNMNINVEKVADFQLVLSQEMATMDGGMATMREDMTAIREMLMRLMPPQ